MSDEIATVLLAAGQSSRLGTPKQLVNVHGEPLIRRMAKVALGASPRPVIVVEGAIALNNSLKGLPLKIIHNTMWKEGLGSSIAAGIGAVSENCTATLVLLADQWALNSDDLQQLIAAHNTHEAGITAADYGAAIGPPVIFSSTCFPALRQLKQERGARVILNRFNHQLQAVSMPHAACDLDTKDDWEELQAATLASIN